jgi:hypothetical protein
MFLPVALILISVAPAFAQEANARISGLITDPQKAVITGVNVVAVNVDTNVKFPAKTNGSGIYVLEGLPIGDYRVEVEHTGFKSIVEPGITLHTQDALELNFEMALGSASETVTVNGAATNDSPAVSMTVDREFVENMPLNGRSFQDLIQLAPGAVDAIFYSGENAGGYYSIDGQRTDSNNYTVDGVSANLGGINNNAGPALGPGPGLSGSAPAQTILGTTQSLASVDTLQEFTIQTSGYTAEFGRSPGGQVQFTTRSGTNDLHGTLFDYLRNTDFDANSFYNDYINTPQTAEHQNDFGGTFGGPVIVPHIYDGKSRTFFFFSYEGLRLLLPSYESEYVPTQVFRSAASVNVQPFLDVAPLPNSSTAGDKCTVSGTTINTSGSAGPNATPCDEQFNYGYSYPNNIDNYSGRIDQAFGERYHFFARFADTPSSIRTGVEDVETQTVNVYSWTAGLTATISSALVDDLRFNYSQDVEQAIFSPVAIAGASPFAESLLVPPGYASPYDEVGTSVFISGTQVREADYYRGSGSTQHQFQIVDNLSWTKSRHSIKFGLDWRRLTPEIVSTPYEAFLQIRSITNLQQGYATSVRLEATAPGAPVFDNFSLYAQDHWKISPRLSVDYGLRWDFNPPPGPSNGHYPIVITSDNLATATLAPTGTQPYQTDYHGFGPRIGFAWGAIPNQRFGLSVRGGFGIFFDTAQQQIGEAYAEGYPFNVQSSQSQVQLPLTDAELAPPSLNAPLTQPYGNLNDVSPSDLTMPYTEQWNLALDMALNPKNVFTASYVGNGGRKLLFSEDYYPSVGNFQNGVNLTTNAAQSGYNALQILDSGRIVNGLDVVGSFTWAHALDNGSNDNVGNPPVWGNSDNDLRRVLNIALNYQTPTVGTSRLAHATTGGWVLANRFSTQSGFPLFVYQTVAENADGSTSLYTPDLVPGVPIYLHGSATSGCSMQPVPGNWCLNPSAFAQVATDPNTGNPISEGTLGRNYVRSPAFWSLNTSMQRSFPIREQFRAIFRVDAFNIFNHPNLDLIDPGETDSLFGQSTGAAGTIGTNNSLYGMGAARSLQFSLKLQF